MDWILAEKWPSFFVFLLWLGRRIWLPKIWTWLTHGKTPFSRVYHKQAISPIACFLVEAYTRSLFASAQTLLYCSRNVMTYKHRHLRFVDLSYEMQSSFLLRSVSPFLWPSLQPLLDPSRLIPCCRAQFHVEAQTQFPLTPTQPLADCLRWEMIH